VSNIRFVDDWEIIRPAAGGSILRGRDRYRGSRIDAKIQWGAVDIQPSTSHPGRMWVFKFGTDGQLYYLGKIGRGYVFERDT